MAKVISNIRMVVSRVPASIYRNRTNYVYIRLHSELINQNNRKQTTDDLLYEKNLTLYRISKKEVLKTLQEILSISRVTATEILTNNKQLCEVPPKLILDNYDMCKLYCITKGSIRNCPYILSLKDLPEKLHLLNQLPEDINKMVGLLKMNIDDLSKIIYQFKEEGNRVTYFSNLLDATPLEICEQIREKPFLMTVNLEKVPEIINLFREHGITNREILNDLWVLNYRKSTMEQRIQFAKENNLEKIKTWMIRAPYQILLNYIKIRSENKLILGNNSLTEYLSNRLECPVEQANYIVAKLPALKGKSVKKMDEIIDYLYEQGFKPTQICITPKILLHSVETMRKRILELHVQGVYPDNLNVLTKTQKQYTIYLSKLVSENEKKLKAIMKKK